jgi:hypothetical protein
MAHIEASVKDVFPLNTLVASGVNVLSYCILKTRMFFSRFSPDNDIEELKEEIWGDLSSVYYKYEDNNQKKAFREVIVDISSKLNSGKWKAIYNKLHSIECKNK